jgi:hypothetical protein
MGLYTLYFNENEFSEALDKISMDFFGHTNWEFVKGEKGKSYTFKFNVQKPKELNE